MFTVYSGITIYTYVPYGSLYQDCAQPPSKLPIPKHRRYAQYHHTKLSNPFLSH